MVLKSANKTSLNFKNEIPVTQWTIEYWIKFDNTTGRPTGDWVGPANIAFRRLIFADNSAPISFNGVLLRYWADGAKRLRHVCSVSWMETILIVRNFGIRIYGITLLILMTDLLFPL